MLNLEAAFNYDQRHKIVQLLMKSLRSTGVFVNVENLKNDFTTLLKVAQTASTLSPRLHLKAPSVTAAAGAAAASAGGRLETEAEHLLGWIRHLRAQESQRLEALADGVDVGHSHKHHLTVGVVFCSSKGGKQRFKKKKKEKKKEKNQEAKTSCI